MELIMVLLDFLKNVGRKLLDSDAEAAKII